MLYVFHPMLSHNAQHLRDEVEVLDQLNIPHGFLLSEIPRGSIVIPRYRMLPFAKELEAEIKSMGSKLINSYIEHRSVADLYKWVHLLEDLTPPAYQTHEIETLPQGRYFLKGETNSKKSNWFESSYASNKNQVTTVARNLLNDQYIGTQALVIRPFQDYRQIGTAVHGQPVFHERRAFYLDGELLTEAHYWPTHEFGAPEILNPAAFEQIKVDAIARVKHIARFLVIDYAEYEDGSWGVVELNDGAMSGLSDNDPKVLWAKLKERLK